MTSTETYACERHLKAALDHQTQRIRIHGAQLKVTLRKGVPNKNQPCSTCQAPSVLSVLEQMLGTLWS